MRNDDIDTLPEDIDADRVRATGRGIAGGWVVVAAIAALMALLPPAVCAASVAFADARQEIAKVEQRVAQAVPRFAGREHRC